MHGRHSRIIVRWIFIPVASCCINRMRCPLVVTTVTGLCVPGLCVAASRHRDISPCSCIYQQAVGLNSLHQHFWAARATPNPYGPCQPNANDAGAQSAIDPPPPPPEPSHHPPPASPPSVTKPTRHLHYRQFGVLGSTRRPNTSSTHKVERGVILLRGAGPAAPPCSSTHACEGSCWRGDITGL